MISKKMKDTALSLRKGGLNAKTYRQQWHKDGNLANRVFELFTAEEQKGIIKGLEDQLAASSIIWIFERNKIKTCLQITRMVQSLSQEKIKKREEYERRRADTICSKIEETERAKPIDIISTVKLEIAE